MSEEQKPRDKLAEGTLISHLLELRDRMMRMCIALVVVFVPCAYFGNEILVFLSEPLKAALPAGSALVSTDVMGVFTTPFTLSFYVALAIVMPYLLFEIWGFVAPGLYRHEKRFAGPLVLSSIVLFYSGMAFAYFLVFPGVFKFLVSITPAGIQMMTDIGKYVSFAMTMFLSFGLAFEVPIVVILLVLTGMVKIEKLTASRGYVIIGIFLVAAVITPTTDAISQLAMAGPMWLLFEGGVIVARLMTRGRPRDEDEADNADDTAKSDA
jgi:sec-independent protein translocase protein TatC